MELRTHIYDCKKPSQNQIPAWMRLQKEKTEEKEPDLVEQFKKNPDSFFRSSAKSPNLCPRL